MLCDGDQAESSSRKVPKYAEEEDDDPNDELEEDVEVGRSKNASRSMLRESSQIIDGVRESLQSCTLAENRGIIEKKLENVKKLTLRNNLCTLRYILDCLTAKVLIKGKASMLSFMEFDEAYAIYQSYHGNDNITSDKYGKDQLRFFLCHHEFGLCVYLFENRGKELIILRPDNIDLKHLLVFLAVGNPDDPEKTVINKTFCRGLVSSMDTEWDKRRAC